MQEYVPQILKYAKAGSTNLDRAHDRLLHGNSTEALAECERELQSNSISAPAYLTMALAYLMEKDHPHAIDACQRALHINPSIPEANGLLSMLYAHSQDWPQAVEYCKAAISADPDNPNFHYQLGCLTGSLEEAEEALTKAIELDPQFALAYYKLATIQIQCEDIGSATSCVKEALILDPSLACAQVLMG